jgi:protein-S-isoprenylcysteine O-methyltransferase Ste14
MEEKPARGPSVPPVYVIVALLAMGAFHVGFPIARFLPPPYHYAGPVLMVLGLALMLWGALHFRRARTAIVPFQPVSALVTSGPYRYTRNPMYLGLGSVVMATAGLSGSLWPVLTLPVAVVLIVVLAIRPEERYLEERFGEAYRAYRARVRRWI